MLIWEELLTLDQLIELDKLSFLEYVIIFKHSTSCSISEVAKLRLEGESEMHIKAFNLDLKSHRDISRLISEKYSIHHESPQILLIKNGECCYDASHFDITISEFREAINEANGVLY